MSLRSRLTAAASNHVRGTVLFLLGLVVLAVLRLAGRDESTSRWRNRRRQVYYENADTADAE